MMARVRLEAETTADATTQRRTSSSYWLEWAAACVTFIVVRSVGGKAPAKVSRPRVEKLLAAVDRRPIRTVFLLRLFFWLSPWINPALALSRLRFRDFAIGSAAGLLLPVGVVALFLDRVLAWLTR